MYMYEHTDRYIMYKCTCIIIDVMLIDLHSEPEAGCSDESFLHHHLQLSGDSHLGLAPPYLQCTLYRYIHVYTMYMYTCMYNVHVHVRTMYIQYIVYVIISYVCIVHVYTCTCTCTGTCIN